MYNLSGTLLALSPLIGNEINYYFLFHLDKKYLIIIYIYTYYNIYICIILDINNIAVNRRNFVGELLLF